LLFFVFISGVGKCLKVVHSATQSVTSGQAMVACASEQARLVSIKTCDQVQRHFMDFNVWSLSRIIHVYFSSILFLDQKQLSMS
jgi:hypothetical protein